MLELATFIKVAGTSLRKQSQSISFHRLALNVQTRHGKYPLDIRRPVIRRRDATIRPLHDVFSSIDCPTDIHDARCPTVPPAHELKKSLVVSARSCLYSFLCYLRTLLYSRSTRPHTCIEPAFAVDQELSSGTGIDWSTEHHRFRVAQRRRRRSRNSPLFLT